MQPCIDIQTIYVPGNKTPYLSALLSDIYFSMGHIAFSQRYAFEANEGMGNFSPRMLQRLVQTSLIYGHYGTAKKYLDILESTLFYKDWATAHRRFLWNDPAVETDSILGSKRKCLFPDNRFSGIKGLDDDLKQIVLKNPMHKTTIQYLGSLYCCPRIFHGSRPPSKHSMAHRRCRPCCPSAFRREWLSLPPETGKHWSDTTYRQLPWSASRNSADNPPKTPTTYGIS